MPKIKKNKCPSCDGVKSPQAQRCRHCFAVDTNRHTWITRDEEFKIKLRGVVRQLAKEHGDEALLKVLVEPKVKEKSYTPKEISLKEYQKKYQKEYGKRPEVKNRQKEQQKKYRLKEKALITANRGF